MVISRANEPDAPTPETIALASQALESFSDVLKNSPKTITFSINDSVLKKGQITISSGILQLIVDVLKVVSRGEAVTLLPSEAELTTQEAADLLNVSRPYLVKLLDEGVIPSRKVGVYRRVKVKEVMQYKQMEQQRQERILDELTKEAQDLDFGY